LKDKIEINIEQVYFFTWYQDTSRKNLWLNRPRIKRLY